MVLAGKLLSQDSLSWTRGGSEVDLDLKLVQRWIRGGSQADQPPQQSMFVHALVVRLAKEVELVIRAMRLHAKG